MNFKILSALIIVFLVIALILFVLLINQNTSNSLADQNIPISIINKNTPILIEDSNENSNEVSNDVLNKNSNEVSNEDSEEDSLKQFILIGVDGMQYAHYREMMSSQTLPNFARLIGSNGFDGNATITGHSNTVTKPGNAELITGVGSSVSGITDNDSDKSLPEGSSTFERLNTFREDIVLGVIYGKNSSYLPVPLLKNAEPKIDWWRAMSDYNYSQYISGTYANSIDVAKEATNFISINANNNFYLMVYFGVPDGAGHKYGENSIEYTNSLVNIDEGLGVLLDSLQTNNILNNTKIIVSGDHGWNEGASGHSNNDINTKTVLLVSNDSFLVSGIYAGGVRRQCDIAPTILDYFGMQPINYADINAFGCGSLSSN